MFEIDDVTEEVLEQAFERFVGNGVYVGLFFISIVYILFFHHKTEGTQKKIKLIFGVYSIVILFLNINPYFVKFMTTLLGETDTYWRVYWLLPIGTAIAYMFTEIIVMQPNKLKKILCTIVIIFLIGLSGDFVYNEENFEKVNNLYKVPDDVLDIIMVISNDEEEYKKIAGPQPFSVYTRQIDGNIYLGQIRNVDGQYSENSIIAYIDKGDYENIYKFCKECKCNYLVLRKDQELSKDYLHKYNVGFIHENETYKLYQFYDITEE